MTTKSAPGSLTRDLAAAEQRRADERAPALRAYREAIRAIVSGKVPALANLQNLAERAEIPAETLAADAALAENAAQLRAEADQLPNRRRDLIAAVEAVVSLDVNHAARLAAMSAREEL